MRPTRLALLLCTFSCLSAAAHSQSLNNNFARDPQQPVVARLKELQTQYAGSDLKVGACQAS